MKKLFLFIILLTTLLFHSPALAAPVDHFFSLDGSDSNSCESWAQRCKSLDKFKDMFEASEPGDRFLFRELDEWNYNNPASEWGTQGDSTLVLTKSGSVGLPLVIGACDASGNYVATSTEANRPIFNFENYYTGLWRSRAIIQFENDTDGVDYVTVENIHFYNSGMYLMEIDSSVSGKNSNIIIEDSKFSKSYSIGLNMEDCRDCLMERIEVTDTNRWNGPDCTVGGSGLYKSSCSNANKCAEQGGTAVLMDNDSEFSVLRDSHIHDNYGEGVGSFSTCNGTDFNVVEGNRVYNNRSTNIHSTDAGLISRYNVTGSVDYGGDGYEPTWNNGTWPNCEDHSNSGNLSFNTQAPPQASCGGTANTYVAYGNMMMGGGEVGVGGSHGSGAVSEGDTLENLFFNNTIIDVQKSFTSTKGVGLRANLLGTDPDGPISEIKANVVDWQDASPDPQYHCVSATPGSRVVYEQNLWDSQPSNSICRDTSAPTDPPYADSGVDGDFNYFLPTAASDMVWSTFAIPSTAAPVDPTDAIPPFTDVDATDTGTGTSLVVDNTYFFVVDDYIVIGTTRTDVRQITAISHGKPGTLTIDSTISRSSGDDVSPTP
ncbi:MAG: right-handed parallel beta-helix repeat-containing protein, partial [Candidatus Thorarchaeota archaeon]